MKNRKCWYWFWIWLPFFIACSMENNVPCQSETIADYPVLIHDYFAHHPISYQDSTFINSIDRVVAGKKFARTLPNHNFHFKDCKEAQTLAESDFQNGMPTLIQFNGLGGDFPLENEIYTQVMGVFIKNTGCSTYRYADCYNAKMWTLIDNHFGGDMRQLLDILDLKYRCLVIDMDQSRSIEVDKMPTIFKVPQAADTTKCNTINILWGKFLIKVHKTGEAKILEYLKGTLDCNCEMKMRKYFESIQWEPATIDGNSIDCVVAFQFMG